jgi:glutaredoxin
MKTAADSTKSAWRQTLVALALVGLTLPAAALYKVVGPDGRITYTDRPPTDTAARVTTINRSGVNEVPAPQDGLPADLRQTATRYPVTLYSAGDCPPCDTGRQMLVQRGVPFTEKLIVSNDDAAAMERVLGARTVPSLTIGSQALRGLSQDEWASYLDAAGYPRESKLPKNWQAPAAAPMVERSIPRPAAPQAAVASAPARSAPAAATPVVPPAPAGIRF